MGGKVAIALGLVAGAVVGGLLVGLAIALVPVQAPAPVPTAAPTATASPAPPTAPTDTGTTPDPSTAPGNSAPSPDLASPDAGTTPDASPVAAGAFNIGQPAPPLRLPAVGGGSVDLASLRGQPVWVNLMATWCLPCRDELPLMQRFAAKYEDAGLVVLLVDVGEDEAAVKAFLDELNVYLPAALDEDGTAQAEWGAAALPVHFWLDEDGIVREWALGGLGPDLMTESLQTILPDESVSL